MARLCGSQTADSPEVQGMVTYFPYLRLNELGSVSDFRVQSPADPIADQARQALSTLDLNGDGRLDAEELRFMLCSVGEITRS